MKPSFINVQLDGVLNNLSSARYAGQSTVDFRTLVRSKRLPLEFLRGCGFPDVFIEYIPSLIADPLLFSSCFISFATLDEEFANKLFADLQNNGIRCYFASRHIVGGKKLHEQIFEAIHVFDRLLVVLSVHSMNSEWVKTEIARARQKEVKGHRQVLFPVSLVPYERIKEWEYFDADTGKDSAREIREYYIPDFSNWKDHDSYQKALKQLLDGLKKQERQPTNDQQDNGR